MDKKNPIEVATALKEYKPGFLPEPLFVSIAHLAVLTAIEFIPLRKTPDGTIQVLLFQRPATDPIWPSMLHTPGTIVRPSDATLDDGFRRLYKDELSNITAVTPIFTGFNLVHYKRGSAVTLEHIVLLDQEPAGGTFYDVDNLPTTFIEEQRVMVQRAVTKFKSL